jgi:hypothetical protein
MTIREYTSPGSFTFTVPQGVTSIIVECIGGGGKGGNATGFGFRAQFAVAGGGAGGSYAKKTISTTPGTSYTVVVGASQNTAGALSGSTGNPSYLASGMTNLVYAQGGQGGGHQENERGYVAVGKAGYGSTVNSIGDILYRGGNGGGNLPESVNGILLTPPKSSCIITYSGPGGGGAGFTARGGDANICTSINGGTGNSPGGNGGNGVFPGNPGNIGLTYGGGGAGGAIRGFAFGTRVGGAGNSGYVRITWDPEEASCRNLYTFANCCPIAVGCNVYSNPQLTTPAEDGYYWDGTKCWIILNGIINSTGSCGTTTSTTTTTTTATPTDFYTVTQYNCPDCDPVGLLVAYSPTTLNSGTYYSIADGNSYLVTGVTSGPSYDVDLTGAISGPSCFSLCVI